MKRILALPFAALTLAAAACGQRDDIWFDGDFSAATTLAKQSGSLVMLVFETDWCTWCDRLERETFSNPDVRSALEGIVALKLDAEGDGKRLAERYGVDSYPTIVFVNADGKEVDRILGYLPPGEFVTESRRIQGGDTVQACLQRPSENPTGTEAVALQRIAVDRADPTRVADHREALRRMEAGPELGDRPSFERLPGVVPEPVVPASE